MGRNSLRVKVSAVDGPDAMCRMYERPPVNRLHSAMTRHTFVRVLDDLPTARDLTLQGAGEALLVPGLNEMIRYAKDDGRRVTLDTNGTLLYRDRSEELVDAKLDRLRVLVDGLDPQGYNPEQVNFGPVLESLAGFMAAKRTAEREVPTVEVVYMVTPRNLSQLPDIVMLLGTLWINDMRVQFRAPVEPDPDLYPQAKPEPADLDPVVVGKVFAKAQRTAEEYFVPLHLPKPDQREPEYDRTPYVTTNGVLRSCGPTESAVAEPVGEVRKAA